MLEERWSPEGEDREEVGDGWQAWAHSVPASGPAEGESRGQILHEATSRMQIRPHPALTDAVVSGPDVFTQMTPRATSSLHGWRSTSRQPVFQPGASGGRRGKGLKSDLEVR